MKKLLSSMLVVVSFFPSVVAASAFSDVNPTYPYYDAINYVLNAGIVQGYAGGSYLPDAQINRAEFTKIVVGALYTQDKISSCVPAVTFPDVAKTDWFYEYACMAVNEGIAHGYPDGTFQPANYINFAEASKMLVSAYDISNAAHSGPWYQQYVEAIQGKNAAPVSVKGADQKITRGEMAQMIYKLKDSLPAWAKVKASGN